MKETRICSNCKIQKTLMKSSWYADDQCSACRARTRYRNSNRNEYKNRWRSENKKHCKEIRLAYLLKKNKDPMFKIKKNLRNRLNQAVKNNQKTGSAVDDLGCLIKELKTHLELQFQDNMSWDNYGEWHIDHIKPLASFDLTIEEELKKACHYSNLQPLWAKNNIIKGDKV